MSISALRVVPEEGNVKACNVGLGVRHVRVTLKGLILVFAKDVV